MGSLSLSAADPLRSLAPQDSRGRCPSMFMLRPGGQGGAQADHAASRATADESARGYAQVLLSRMQHAEAVAAVGPDQHQSVLTVRDAGECTGHIRGRLLGVPVYFQDDVAAL